MFYFSQIFRVARKGLCILLLCIMSWQQWKTFSGYQERFLNPVQFAKQYYGSDAISQNKNRYLEVKKLFTKPTRLNYVSEANESYGIFEGYFAISQYYLAPNLILRNNVVCDTILYNLYSTIHIDPATNVHLQNGWHVVKDFNNGLIVIAK